MFKRVNYEAWTEGLPEISFWLTFTIFLIILLSVLFMRKEKIKHMENLPLENDEKFLAKKSSHETR
jgi:hypothetical protein